MIKNESERVCTLCKSVFNLFLPLVSLDLELPVVELISEKDIKCFTIDELE